MDREPISPERADESCHIAIIGDPFIEAWQVPIADKVQVKLEELAAQELPRLDITTSAFGRRAYGQINQLAFYDEYARRLSPKVVALVFVNNDFDDNSVHLNALGLGIDPDHLPRVTAVRGAVGQPELRPPLIMRRSDCRRHRLTTGRKSLTAIMAMPSLTSHLLSSAQATLPNAPMLKSPSIPTSQNGWMPRGRRRSLVKRRATLR